MEGARTNGGLPGWARWGPVVAAVAAGAALVASAVLGYAGVRRSSGTLARGQGDIFLQAAHGLLGPRGGPPTSADLAEFLARNEADGLRYVALLGSDGGAVAQAGSPSGAPLPRDPAALRPGALADVGGRVRMVVPPPPAPHGGFPPPGGKRRPTPGGSWPPPGAPRPPPGAPFPPPQPPPLFLLIEFEPLASLDLETEGRRALVVGATGASAFLVFAVLLGRALRQRGALERRLERGRRLAALGEMSAVLAHEIRNPLASLKGHAQLLVESLPAEGPERSKADLVVREAVRLEALTTDLLDFVRSGGIDRRPSDPAEVLRAAAEDAGASRLELRVERAPARWPLDPTRMRQALANVLRNAVQASPEGALADASAAEEDGRLVFTVRDRGEGVPPGEEERIFEPFHTRRASGTGLGLAVARRVVVQHGGTITAGNHPGGGAVFRISIPRDGRA